MLRWASYPPPTKDGGDAGSNSGGSYSLHQNRKSRKSEEKRVSRAEQASASEEAARIAAMPPPPPPRLTRSQTRKAADQIVRRARSQSRGGRGSSPPSKVSKSAMSPVSSQSGASSDDGVSKRKRRRKRKSKVSGASDSGSEPYVDPSGRPTLKDTAAKERLDPAMQHRSPLVPPVQSPIRDQAEWNVQGSLFQYHLDAKRAQQHKSLDTPGHVPGMIRGNIVSVAEVMQNPQLLEASSCDEEGPGSSMAGPSSADLPPFSAPPGAEQEARSGTPSRKRGRGPTAAASSHPDLSGEGATGGHRPDTSGLGTDGAPFQRPATAWVYPRDPGTGTTEPFYFQDGIPRPYFGWTYPDQMVGRRLGCSTVRAMDQPQEKEEFLGGQVEKVLNDWSALLDRTGRSLNSDDLSHYDDLLKCYAALNNHVERRRQDIVNCEGYAQNILVRGEHLLKRFHTRLMAELATAEGSVDLCRQHSDSIEQQSAQKSKEIVTLRRDAAGVTNSSCFCESSHK